MSKLPFMQWYPADWMKDTRHLSLAAKGAYVDLLNLMWVNEECRGQYQATRVGLIRAIGISNEDLDSLLAEIKTVCSVTLCHENVTFVSRRITKEEKQRKNNLIRQDRHREKQSVTPLSRDSHRDIAEIRDQKTEDKGQKTSTPTPPAAAPEKAAPTAPAGVPFQDFFKLWNDNAGRLPRVSALTDKRKQKIRARWGDNANMDYWLAVIRRMSRSRFMCGGSERGWTADFDWLITNDTNHVKVMEGKYDDKEVLPNAPHGRQSDPRDTDLARRAIETQGLRKPDFQGPAGALLDRIRDSKLHEGQAKEPERPRDKPDGQPVV